MRMHKGFSLLEILIASALLATALLGLAALAARAVQDAANGRDDIAAFALLQDLEGRMALSGGRPAWSLSAAVALPEWQAWKAQVAQRLPNATVTLCHDATPNDGSASDDACDGHGALVVKLHWWRFTESGAQRRSRSLEA